jgi:chemotaxis protein methyltransferase CheR
MSTVNTINESDYERFKVFLEKACGIILGSGKQYLITSRLTKLLRDEKLETFSELITMVERGYPRHIRDKVIDAMTTNETSWFRDRSPFEVLDKVIFPELEQSLKGQCKIWSAACSSGQEPYTISMTLSEYLSQKPQSKLKSTQITATDISPSMIEQAKSAEYDEAILGRGLSGDRKRQFFEKKGDNWTVTPVVKQRVSFRQQNLLDNYVGLGKFDVIFCRNVLIYFSAERKTDILTRMATSLNPGGYLFLGASETVTGYSNAFEMVRSRQGVLFRQKQ